MSSPPLRPRPAAPEVNRTHQVVPRTPADRWAHDHSRPAPGMGPGFRLPGADQMSHVERLAPNPPYRVRPEPRLGPQANPGARCPRRPSAMASPARAMRPGEEGRSAGHERRATPPPRGGGPCGQPGAARRVPRGARLRGGGGGQWPGGPGAAQGRAASEGRAPGPDDAGDERLGADEARPGGPDAEFAALIEQALRGRQPGATAEPSKLPLPDRFSISTSCCSRSSW